MIKKLAAIAVLLGLAAICCPKVGAQTRTINLGKSLVRVADPGALSMPGMPGMPVVTFPNTYASTATASFDPNAGTAGTLHLHYSFTGTTQPSPMQTQNVKHFPNISVQISKNGVGRTIHYGGGLSYGISPSAQMSMSFDLAFDLGVDFCDINSLVSGDCTLAEEQDNVQCIVAGVFATFLKDIQFEYAGDQFLGTYAPTPPGGQNLTLNCLMPPYAAAPDWGPAAGGLPTWTLSPGAPSHPHDFMAVAELYRFVPIFYSKPPGTPWYFLAQFGGTTFSDDYGSVACTNKDANQKGPGGF